LAVLVLRCVANNVVPGVDRNEGQTKYPDDDWSRFILGYISMTVGVDASIVIENITVYLA
jgi:hypothetical protein